MKCSRFLASLLASLVFVGCNNKDNPTPPETPDPEIGPKADLELVMDRTTKVLYYGDRKTEGVFNYYVGLGDKEFIKDNEGDDAAPADGHIIFFDIYASEGSDSFETAVLPDGKYTIAETNAAGTLNNYYTRMQVNVEGKQTSVDFTEGYLEVKTSEKGKILKGLFTLKDGSTVSCIYEGPLAFGDPNAGSEPSEQIPALEEDINVSFAHAFGVYYGDEFGSGTDGYSVVLTSPTAGNDGVTVSGGAVVGLSLTLENSSVIYLMPGIYTVADTYAAGTIEPGFSLLGEYYGSIAATVDAEGNILSQSGIASGTALVSEFGDTGYRIELELVTDNGKSVKGVFTGDIEFTDESPKEEDNTTLTGDYTLKLPAETTTASLAYYGDYLGVGLANWILSLENANGDAIDIELLTEKASTTEIPIPEKQYNMSVDNQTVGFVAGKTSPLGQSGTWYWDLSTLDSDGYLHGYAAAIDGWVKLAKDGDKTTVSFEFVDPAYNLFGGSWTGVIPAAVDKSNLAGSSSIKSRLTHRAQPSLRRRARSMSW